MSQIKPTIYVVSDSIGETAETVVRAAISQFPDESFEMIRLPNVREFSQIDILLSEIQNTTTIIAHTLISPKLRTYLSVRCQQNHITTVDIMGPIMSAVGTITKSSPNLEPGLVHRLDSEYFKKVNSIEFAVKYDDGKNPTGFLHADIVLVGVSRTSKTPLSMYLGNKKIKVANLPLEPEVPLPPEIFQVPPYKIIGLCVSKEKLSSIRSERLRTIGLEPEANYSNVNWIEKELEYANSVMYRLHCRVIDVTNKAIEETASEIIEIVQKNRERYGEE